MITTLRNALIWQHWEYRRIPPIGRYLLIPTFPLPQKKKLCKLICESNIRADPWITCLPSHIRPQKANAHAIYKEAQSPNPGPDVGLSTEPQTGDVSRASHRKALGGTGHPTLPRAYLASTACVAQREVPRQLKIDCNDKQYVK